MTLDAVEFIRRFLLHVFPSGFVHIRHFGFLANRRRRAQLALCRSLLRAQQSVESSAGSASGSAADEPKVRLCPVCKVGRLILVQALSPEALAGLPAPILANTS